MLRLPFAHLLALAAIALPSSGGERAVMLPAAAGDLVAHTLRAPTAAPAGGGGEPALAVGWPIPADRDLDLEARPFVARSRSFTLEVSAAELVAGVTVPTVHPGAVVRLVPTFAGVAPAGPATALDPGKLVITDPAGVEHGHGAALSLPVGPEALRATGVPFAPGTLAFRLAEEQGAGAFVLRAPTLEAAGPGYRIHVFERDSDLVLSLATLSDAYLAGDTVRAVAELRGSGPAPVIDAIEARVVSPSGRHQALTLRREAPGRFAGEIVLDSDEPMADGPWQIAARVRGSWNGLAVDRDAHTSFGYAVPTARLTGQVGVERDGDALALTLGVETATPGRYEVRGVVFGTDAGGGLRPLAVGHSAAWLPAGVGALSLQFDARTMRSSPLGPPYELGDLRLLDQRRLGLLHRQARGVSIE